MCEADMLVERHQARLERATEILLREVPPEGIPYDREQLAQLIRAAFMAGITASVIANKFDVPCGVPTFGRN